MYNYRKSVNIKINDKYYTMDTNMWEHNIIIKERKIR